MPWRPSPPEHRWGEPSDRHEDFSPAPVCTVGPGAEGHLERGYSVLEGKAHVALRRKLELDQAKVAGWTRHLLYSYDALTCLCHPSGRAEGRRFAPGGVGGAGRLKQPMERTPTGTYRTQEVGTAHPPALVKLAFCQNTKQLISQFKSPRVAHTSPVPCRLATTPSPHSADRSRVATVC